MINVENIKCYVGEDGTFKGVNFDGTIIDLDTVYDSYDDFVDDWFDEDEEVCETDFALVGDKYICSVGGSNDTLYFTINGDEITIFYEEYNSMMNDFDTCTVVFNYVSKTFREV